MSATPVILLLLCGCAVTALVVLLGVGVALWSSDLWRAVQGLDDEPLDPAGPDPDRRCAP